jgi:hypothetical protein
MWEQLIGVYVHDCLLGCLTLKDLRVSGERVTPKY